MITTISLINIHHHAELQNYFFLVMRTFKIYSLRASLVAQWLRIHLPMQETWVRALVWEDPTSHRAAKPVHHNY